MENNDPVYCPCYDCNYLCYCCYCLYFRNLQAPLLNYNPPCGITYTYDLRNHECLYPERDYWCPVYYTISGDGTIVIPRPQYGVPRVYGAGPAFPAHWPQAPAPPQDIPHEQYGGAFYTPWSTSPLHRPVASNIPGFAAFGRRASV